MNMTDFTDISYLKDGNDRQRSAYRAINRIGIMERLAVYDPILAGTIPIGVDVPGSDLDIICCHNGDAAGFDACVAGAFAGCGGWSVRRFDEAVVCSFEDSGFTFEVFGQDVPTQFQNAYLHMLIEYSLLEERGEDFRREVVRLKSEGLKTEPAFAYLLGLDGDPYDALMRYGVSTGIISPNDTYHR